MGRLEYINKNCQCMTHSEYELQCMYDKEGLAWTTCNRGGRDEMIEKLGERATILEQSDYRDTYRIVKILPIEIVMKATVVDNGDE